MFCDYCEKTIDDDTEFACRCGTHFCEDCWYGQHESECSYALEEGPLT